MDYKSGFINAAEKLWTTSLAFLAVARERSFTNFHASKQPSVQKDVTVLKLSLLTPFGPKKLLA
jgi:hypothetical protein